MTLSHLILLIIVILRGIISSDFKRQSFETIEFKLRGRVGHSNLKYINIKSK